MKTAGWKSVFTTTLTLTLSPGERGQVLDLAGDLGEVWASSPVWIAERRRRVLPLLGERAGGRAGVWLLAIFLFSATCALAQYAINWHTIDGGGGTSTGGVYSVSGTIGQPDAGSTMTNGQYSVTGGFWALPTAVQTEGAPTLTITKGAPGFANISWSPAATNWVLQERLSLTAGSWSNAPSGATNPVVVPAAMPMKFYRLFKP